MEKDLKILKSKTLADGSKYFSLFEKHIPVLNAGSSVYLYMLGNLPCICEIIKKNPNVNYFIHDSDEVINAVQLVLDGYDISKTVDVYDIDMKFDCIIMNPPYQKNLHLKILAEAIKHLKDDDSKVVNLSPVRWLQDPLAKYKKNNDYHRFKESIINHLANVCVIDDEAQAIFGDTRFGFDIAIYDARRNNENFNVDSLVNSIAIKVLSANLSKIVFDTNKKDGIRVRFPLLCSNGDNVKYMSSIGKMIWFVEGMKDNKPWYAFYTKNQFSKFTDTIPYSAKFNSEIEADNFCKSYDTNFAKVYTHIIKRDVNISPDIVLWMGDSINPRTGLKGYTGEWTDEDFYHYFKLTDDEIKTIEDTMAKYAK